MKPILLSFLLVCGSASASEIDSQFETRLLAAIRTEEGAKFAYGITFKDSAGKFHGYDEAKAKEICKRTIEHSWQRYEAAGVKGSFVSWLGKTYAQDKLWPQKIERILNGKIN